MSERVESTIYTGMLKVTITVDKVGNEEWCAKDYEYYKYARKTIHRPLQTVKAAILTKILPSLLDGCIWVYPTSARSEVYQSGRCVYFLSERYGSEVIKIGQTSNLASRTGNYRKQFGVYPHVLAFIKTDDNKMLERCIHAALADYRVGGEWFKFPPVMDFIVKYGPPLNGGHTRD